MTKEYLTKEYLDSLTDGFHIITTKGEHFFVRKKSDGERYIFKDMVPPVLELELDDYCSVKLVQSQIERLQSGTSESTWTTLPGITSGLFLGFRKAGEEEFLLSKGKIDQCYYELDIDVLTLRSHVLEIPGKKIHLDELDPNFELLTKSDVYRFISHDERLFFENREVLRIGSIFNAKNQINQTNFTIQRVLDTSEDFIYINRPFLIITKDEEVQSKIRFTYVIEPLKALRSV